MDERKYVFTFSLGAVSYILALLNKRPREESNEFYLAIERTIKEQDEEYSKGKMPPPEFLELLKNAAPNQHGNGQDAMEAKL